MRHQQFVGLCCGGGGDGGVADAVSVDIVGRQRSAGRGQQPAGPPPCVTRRARGRPCISLSPPSLSPPNATHGLRYSLSTPR